MTGGWFLPFHDVSSPLRSRRRRHMIIWPIVMSSPTIFDMTYCSLLCPRPSRGRHNNLGNYQVFVSSHSGRICNNLTDWRRQKEIKGSNMNLNISYPPTWKLLMIRSRVFDYQNIFTWPTLFCVFALKSRRRRHNNWLDYCVFAFDF